MSIRKKCVKYGHKFYEIDVPLPYVFCARWWCDASAVSRWAEPELAVMLHNAIPVANRVPPVTLNDDGTVQP